MFDAVPNPSPWKDANERRLLGPSGLQPIQILQALNDEQFENFILEWVHGYLKNIYNYTQVFKYGGAGDKGRDIVAWLEPSGAPNRKCDYYQCKRFDRPLSPDTLWVELGKICYYTFKNEIPIPENYYLVTCKGIGSKLLDLLENPHLLKRGLLKKWVDKCEGGITKREKVILTEDLKQHIESMNFGLFKAYPEMDLIEQHSKTPYYNVLFGKPLKQRAIPPPPPTDIDGQKETVYVQEIYNAFSDHLKHPVTCTDDFESISYLFKAFNKAREGFYSAEALKEFSRDSYLGDSIFSGLLDDFHDAISMIINVPHNDGFACMQATTAHGAIVQLASTDLPLRSLDRIGFCHHLVNENRMKWVQ